MLEQINNFFGIFVEFLAPILFMELNSFPLIVLVLLFGAITFTLYFRFINVKGFRHAIDIIKCKYDNPEDTGQISHFQALTSALSATIGLGNIAGVAVAVSLGGPGAVFWMVFIAFFSMSAKFVSCTLGQLYRKVNNDGSVSGGPMYYLSEGLKERGFGTIGKILGGMYAIFIIGGAFGGGNMFQANQSYELFGKLIGIPNYIYGILLAILVGGVIVGGIKRIGQTTEKIVPFMVVLYVIASLFIIFTNLGKLPEVLYSMVSQAFKPDAAYGGFIGALVTGIKRAVFSNEGGVGSASIAHSAAKTDEPVREGIVAMIGPFIDTIVVCFMTASVILITKDANPLYQVGGGINGAELTSAAFGSAISWFPYILSIVVFLFSFSTMISWYYYGDKGWKYLFGESSIKAYQAMYLGCIVLGAVASLGNVIDFSDMMILSCGFPNIIGCLFLLPVLKTKLDEYWARYQANEFKTYK
ncbi:MAG: alanine glycine permease [Candidatus Marinimicrobia bacterium]|nr:alanine glycine permease [Candidatus Neomarinimicrobiota bacterium]|tara:strand:+ start:3803 stop:5215 length:1413 start_codon:yes stop_codon:yes gene_type:complete